MSFNNADPDAFKKYLNKMAQGCRCNGCKPKVSCSPAGPTHSGIVGSNGPCGASSKCKSCDCDDDTECKECAGKKKVIKPRSETVQDDGCFCRKCNTFLPMVEPDDVGDGKTMCYMCKNPW